MATHLQPVTFSLDPAVIDQARGLIEEVYSDEVIYPGSPVTAPLVNMNLEHVDRVRANATAIAAGEGLDPLVLELAATLHDVSKLDHTDSSSGGIDTWHHHHRGASLARKILHAQFSISAGMVERIVQMIERHSDIPFIRRFWTCQYHAELPSPQTREDFALRDADVIDMLWVGGMAKIVNFRQVRGSDFFREDGGDIQKAIASAHTSFHEALGSITTATGKRLAQARIETVQSFFQRVVGVHSLDEFTKVYDRFILEKKSEKA